MKTLYLDCTMGAAGDMITAALLELLPDPPGFVERLNTLRLPGIVYSTERGVRCGVTGTLVHVCVGGEEESDGAGGDAHTRGEYHSIEHPHHHERHTMADIEGIIESLDVPQCVRRDALCVYKLIAEAESRVHGQPVGEVHFHEVGAMDAVADVVAVCLLLHELAPDVIAASPVCVGFGQVRCAHGVLPVPAPATALLLQGIPTFGGTIEGEMCTPTGAALLKHFARSFSGQPSMRVERTGYGLGKKELPAANCVRSFLGEGDEPQGDEVLEIRCNIDDMSAEDLSFAVQELRSLGALDVFTTPVGMKKGRAAILLTCLCRENLREQMIRLIFRHTTTLGVRESLCKRAILLRDVQLIHTAVGDVRVKRAWGYGVRRVKVEHDDLEQIAREKQLPLCTVEQAVRESDDFKALQAWCASPCPKRSS